MVKDPVCGMEVEESNPLSVDYEGQRYHFCSLDCRNKFLIEKGLLEAEKSENEIAGDTVQKATFSLKGMHCASCAANIEDSLRKISGVSGASVNFATEKAYIDYDPNKVGSADLVQAIKDTGYSVLKEDIPRRKYTKITFRIVGMHCAACVANIEDALNKVEGVFKATVNLAVEKAFVEYDPALVNVESLVRTINNAGYGAEPEGIQKLQLKIIGMDNAQHINSIKSALTSIDGVLSIDLYPNEKASISFDLSLTDRDAIEKAIKNAGYIPVEETTVDREKAVRTSEINTLRLRFFIAAGFGIPLLYFAMGHHVGLPIPSFSDGTMALLQLLLTVPIIVVGYQFYLVGFRSVIKTGTATMDTLVALGTGTAFLYSLASSILIWTGNTNYGIDDLYFEVAGLLIVFILFGRMLEAIAKGRTSESIRRLLEIKPKTALVERGGVELEMPAEDVLIGDTVIVKPGTKIPVDGIILEGSSFVDQSLITGESVPVEKNVGDEVIGGTINKDGWLRFNALKVGQDTALAQIVRLVEEAQGSKAPVQRLADKMAAYFVPIVLAIGIITFITWFLSGADPVFALTAFIAVIIIACPCALGLATPTAVIVGTGIGAERGILIKNAETLEKACGVDTVVFDKTGTLTSGTPRVTDVIPMNNLVSDDEILMLAAAAEKRSEHHLSGAIVREAEQKRLVIPNVEHFSSIAGKGVEARCNGATITVANKKYFNERGIDTTAAEGKISSLEEKGKTVVLVTSDDNLKGIIAFADIAKHSAVEAIAQLKKQGRDVVMITGDNKRSAENTCSALGIEHVLADVLPEDKALEIKRLQSEGRIVAMVGDGVNDAPALVQADVGIAIGSGTDVAIESGEVVLVKDDLRDVVRTFELSCSTMRKIKQNLFWAFFYNAIGIPIAAGILYPFFGFMLNPIIAGAAMALSSVSVVTNSLMLRRFHPV